MVHPKTDESDINQALQHYFEFPHFRPGQQQALEHVLSGSDTLVVMPTGHGKSLIYQLAALLMDGTALVISPLVSLMKDQVDSLIRRDIPATFVNSSLSTGEQALRLRDISSGLYKIVLVAPERLMSLPFRKSLSGTRLSMLVVDESHCLSQWGHDFRPDYLHIADARQDFSAPVTLALTATATRQVQDDIQKLLGLPSMVRVITGFNRPNLALDVVYTPDVHSKYKSLLTFLCAAEGAGIIYTGTRRDAEEVTEFIQEVVKIPARYYHAGLDAEARTEVQDAFMSGDLPHVVATNAFGMGIDRPDVRFVLHYTMPGTLEAYYQEAGRAGRDGLNSRAILLYSPQDTALHEYFIENDSPTLKELRQVYEYLHHVENLSNKEPEKGGFFTIRLDVLEAETYLNHVKARVSLEQLEKAQALIRYPTRATSMIQVQLRPLLESNLGDIAAQVQSRRRHKYAMLKKMVHYSETNECRRSAILSHFGDNSSAYSPRCCDNCLATAETDRVTHKPAQNEGEFAALTILDTIARIRPRLGKVKIASILSGSKAKNIARITNFRHYAKLSSLYRREIVAMIDQLLSNGYVKSIGSRLPVLQLTPLGETTLKSRAAVEIDVSQIQRSQRQRRVTHAPEKQESVSKGHPKNCTQHIHAWGESGSQEHISELIGYLEDPNGNVRRLTASALGKLGSAEAVEPLLSLLKKETKPQVRQYTIKALGKIGDNRACTILEQIANDLTEKDYNRKTAKSALRKLETRIPKSQSPSATVGNQDTIKQDELTSLSSADVIDHFITQPHPRSLSGPWLAGWALDFHSRFVGKEHIRSSIGSLVFRYKYDGEFHLAGELSRKWLDLLADHPELPHADIVIPIPPSTPRERDPVIHLAQKLADHLKIPALVKALVKTRATRPQKEMKSLAAKKANIAGSFALRENVKALNLLLVDDLYDSGATLSEAAHTLSHNRPASIVVLTLTKTIHTDK